MDWKNISPSGLMLLLTIAQKFNTLLCSSSGEEDMLVLLDVKYEERSDIPVWRLC